MLYLINPKRRGRTMAKTRRKKKATPAQLRALAKARRALKRKKASRRKAGRKAAVSKRRRRRSTTRRKTVARKRSKRGTRRRSSRRRRSKSRAVTFRPVRGRIYKRNPRFNVRSIMRAFQQGAIDATGVVAGKAATRMLANFLPVPGKDSAIGNFLSQGLSAVVVGTVAQNFVSRDYARMMIAGGLAAPVETLLKQVPMVGDFLGDDYLELGSYYMGEVPLPIGEYPGVGEDLPIGEYVEY